MATTSERLTNCGDQRLVFDPSPTCPYVFWPQAYTSPVDVNTSEWDPPAATATTALSPGICIGDFASVVFPTPSCPDAFLPKLHTFPLSLTTSVKLSPPAARDCANPSFGNRIVNTSDKSVIKRGIP